VGENITADHSGRLVIVSNRLPVVTTKKNGCLTMTTGSGGLVTALAPVLKNRGGVWIGWPGPIEENEYDKVQEMLSEQGKQTGFSLNPVFLSEEEEKLYYSGFANEIIWPLFHDLQSECHFVPVYWYAVQEVNRKFAERIEQHSKKGDFVWVHDYHLMLVGQYLRERIGNEKIGFFLHIPFPPLDIFLKLPWRFQVLRALLEYDLIGFQTLRDQRNFIQCVKKLLPDVNLFNKSHVYICQTATREVRIGAFPISIDFQEFSKRAASNEVSTQVGSIHEHLKGQRIVFSCDRLDISKGIPYRLEAIRHLLSKHSELLEKVTFFQVVIPSRVEIPKYQNLKQEIDRLVGEINSQFGKVGWVPIQYLYHSISREELLAYYRFSEVALITPIKDGMNLVAKEYVASNVNEDGVLVLSEFAGAATQLQHEALLINPYDIEGVAETIYIALTFPLLDRKKRMRKMRRRVQQFDVFWWVKAFLKSAISKDLNDFPVIEEYMPHE